MHDKIQDVPPFGLWWRLLAITDAVLVPAAGVLWARSWPSGALLATVVATGMVFWGLLRVRRAVLQFEQYRFISIWLAKGVALVLLLGVAGKAVLWLMG